MTVTTIYSPLTFNCNGSVDDFSVTWPFFLTSDFRVTHIADTGIETILALTTNYTVTGGRDSNGLPAVGTVSTVVTYPAGAQVRIERVTPRTQQISLTSSGAFQAKSIEAALDRAHMIAEEGTIAAETVDIDGAVMRLETSAAVDYWDGDAHIARGFADATASTDLVTLQQMQAMQLAAGSGDVIGPAVAPVDGDVVAFDGITGKLLRSTPLNISSDGRVGWNVANTSVTWHLSQIAALNEDTRLTISNTQGNRAAITLSNASHHITMAMGAPAVTTLGSRFGIGLSTSGIYGMVMEHGAANGGGLRDGYIGILVGATAAVAPLTVGESENLDTPTPRMAVFNAGPSYGAYRDTSSNSELYIGANPSGGVIGTPTTTPLIFNVNDLEVARFDNSNGHLTLNSKQTRGMIAGTETSHGAVVGQVPLDFGGRLTLTTATPVMIATVSGATTVYFTPDKHQFTPIYNGTIWIMTDLGGELSQATTDASKSPAAVAADKCYDVFVWDDAGTKRATRGPAWSSDTARGTGAATSELERVQGVLLNKYAITNGPAAQRGTYVGTIRSNGSSQITWILGGLAAGGTAASFGVWNAFNRRDVRAMVRDATDSWTLASTAFQPANNSTANRVSFVCGLEEDWHEASYSGGVSPGVSGQASVGVGYDSTTAFTGQIGWNGVASVPVTLSGSHVTTAIGWHYFQAMESARAAGTATFYGDAGVSGHVQNGLQYRGRA